MFNKESKRTVDFYIKAYKKQVDKYTGKVEHQHMQESKGATEPKILDEIIEPICRQILKLTRTKKYEIKQHQDISQGLRGADVTFFPYVFVCSFLTAKNKLICTLYFRPTLQRAHQNGIDSDQLKLYLRDRSMPVKAGEHETKIGLKYELKPIPGNFTAKNIIQWQYPTLYAHLNNGSWIDRAKRIIIPTDKNRLMFRIIDREDMDGLTQISNIGGRQFISKDPLKDKHYESAWHADIVKSKLSMTGNHRKDQISNLKNNLDKILTPKNSSVQVDLKGCLSICGSASTSIEVEYID